MGANYRSKHFFVFFSIVNGAKNFVNVMLLFRQKHNTVCDLTIFAHRAKALEGSLPSAWASAGGGGKGGSCSPPWKKICGRPWPSVMISNTIRSKVTRDPFYKLKLILL
jgi:hypothetical protein